MSSLTLNLSKPGDAAPKLALNLNKGERFRVRLAWEGSNDLDLHALLCVNAGSGAKAAGFGDILSTYNVRRRIGGQEVGTLIPAADGSFSIHGSALKHSPDARDGDQLEIDEWLEIDPAALTPPANGTLEIPLVAMIHPQSSGLCFRDVRQATVIVETASGQPLLRVALGHEFGEFIGVQMGSIVVSQGRAEFVAIGVGFNGDFNAVLAHFS